MMIFPIGHTLNMKIPSNTTHSHTHIYKHTHIIKYSYTKCFSCGLWEYVNEGDPQTPTHMYGIHLKCHGSTQWNTILRTRHPLPVYSKRGKQCITKVLLAGPVIDGHATLHLS